MEIKALIILSLVVVFNTEAEMVSACCSDTLPFNKYHGDHIQGSLALRFSEGISSVLYIEQ